MSLQQFMAQTGQALENLRGIVPEVIGALVVVLTGWLVARLSSRWLRRLTASVIAKTGGEIARTRHPGTAGTLVGTFTFWLVFLLFVSAAVNMLGLPFVTETLSRFVYFMPNLFAAGIIVVIGMLVGDVSRGALTRTLQRAGVEQATTLGKVVRVVIIAIALVVAIEEVGIDGQLLVLLVAITVGTGLAGAGLAFGLGARTAVSNIIASHHLPDEYREGRTVRIREIEGRIIATTPSAVVVATSDAHVTIPAKCFGEEISHLVMEQHSP